MRDITSDIILFVTKADKLIKKLGRGAIGARELRTLMSHFGFEHKHGKGSHEYWSDGERIIVISPHGDELKPYQIRAAAKALLGGTDGEEDPAH